MSAKGSVILEVVVAAAIMAVVALAFLGSFALLTRVHERNMLFIKGDLLAEEGLEAMRFIKAAGWSNLSAIPSGGARYLAVGTSTWGVTTTPERVDGDFYRTIKVYSVFRNSSDDIVTSGGTVDSNTLLTESSVSWSYRGATTTATYKTYVTNI
ncbi:MAG TPA: hypothetical protein VHD69_02880 [Candidatus Paceibacterota bacterium]|nr:hypothetical protein [Candidatus Paceibacterota bacterium]